MAELKTVDEVIGALGGPSAAARITGRSVSAPTNWKNDGKLPSRTFLRVTAELEKLGHTASPSIWGMDPPEHGS